MNGDILLTLAIVVGSLTALATNRLAPDITMMAALVLVIVLGVISPEAALEGFANPGLMTIGALYVVAAALRDTGAIYWVAHRLLGQPNGERGAQLRLVAPTSMLSAFLNNTTVVAMMIPAVQEWARRLKLSPSKLLLPLSYSAILGGTCTLIGTSTNLVVDSLAQARGLPGFGIFDLAWIGIPILVVGSTLMVLFADRLLPNREGFADQLEHAREYQVEMRIPAGSPLIGRTIQDAGLRNLSHGTLTELRRCTEETADAESSTTRLEAEDMLAFTGAPETARELQRIDGLRPAHGGVDELGLRSHQRLLVEVVLSPEFPYIDRAIAEADFRSRYQAAVLSISRNGRRLPGTVGDQEFRAGDTLLLETSWTFVEQFQFRRDFMLVSPLEDSTPPDFRKAPLAVSILIGMVAANALGFASVLEAVLVTAGLLLATRCVTLNRARMNVSVNLPVLVVIGASFALGRALEESGAAAWVADSVLRGRELSPWLALAGVYLLTALFTELITNNAAAVLVFPIAVDVAKSLGADPLPFVVAVMIGASASFLTPLGYQTNLMVMGPGGYSFSDYLRLGLPVSLAVGTVSVALIPLIWPF